MMVPVNMLLCYSITGEAPQRHSRGPLKVMYVMRAEYKEAKQYDRPKDAISTFDIFMIFVY